MTTKTLTYVFLGKDKVSSVGKKAGEEVEKSGGVMSGAVSKAGLAWLGLGGVVTEVIGHAIKEARGLNVTPLKQAAKDAGISWSALSPKIEEAGTKMAGLGFTQGQTNQSLTKLITVTGSSKASLDALAGAADLARYKHISLSDATGSLAKAAAGNTRALKELGISTSDLPKHFSSTGTAATRLDTVMGLLNKKIGGQASAYTQTFGGKLEVLKTKFGEVEERIGSALLPILSQLMGMISSLVLPYLVKFSDWMVKVGSPAILRFAKQAMPFVIGVIKDFAAGISALMKVLSYLPGPVKIAIIAITALGVAIKIAMANPWTVLIIALIVVVGLIARNWDKIRKITIEAWNAVLGFLKGVWNAVVTVFKNFTLLGLIISHWQQIKNATVSAWNGILGWIKHIPGWILGVFAGFGTLLYHKGTDLMSGLWNGIKFIWGKAYGWLKQIPGWILQPYINAGTWLYDAGKNVIQGFWNGLTFIWKKVTGWISGLANWIKQHKGPVSLDQKLLEPAGRALMQGLKVGIMGGFTSIKDIVTGAAGNIANWLAGAGGKVAGFFAKLFGGGGSGVERWRGVVMAALALNGLPGGLANQVLHQISTESGGNPNAINLSDINAQRGDPSRGLLQTIGSTFSAYHVAGTSMNIYDPLANVAAAINYAKHVYGPGLMSGSGGLGSGHGYAFGTSSASRGWAWVGERGPELMHFGGGEQIAPMAGSRGGAMVWTGDVVIQGHALASKQELARIVSDALQSFERKGGRV